MNHIVYSQQTTYPHAILIKETYLDSARIKENYLTNFNPNDFIVFGLPYLQKMTISAAKANLNRLLPALVKLGVTTLYVADATYFKALTKKTQAEKFIGYVLPCTIKNFEHINVIFGVNYGQLIYNPNLLSKLELSLDTLKRHLDGDKHELGSDIIHSAEYNNPLALAKYLNEPKLFIDIETTGLKVGSKILSIAFAKDKHNGIAFKTDDLSHLKRFFELYRGKKIFHNATFDVKHIIYNCFMKHPNDTFGMLHGLDTMCNNLEDTKIIAYLATNNTQGNELGLKPLSHEYTGNYGVNVENLTEATDEILEYNLKDTLGTSYVYEKYWPILLQDNQLDIYENIMMPSIKTIIQMELIGMPVDMIQVDRVRKELEQLQANSMQTISNNPYVKQAEHELKLLKLIDINSKLKVKQHGMEAVKDFVFNPGSGKHLQHLFYSSLKLPVIDTTDSKQPAVGAATIAKLIHHTHDDSVKELLQAFIDLNKVSKILSTFIPALESSTPRDNWHYLQGNFNMGGTLSGRMSSNSPNLQNIPSSSTHAKLIKSCFKAKPGWLMVGADYQALEDKVNTVLTKDPNKEKIWVDGYDAHCFRAYYYFKDQMPDIEETVESINSIKEKYEKLRGLSKAPSFALQYGGQYFTLMNNCGFDEATAKAIEANYHKMYTVSDQWVADKIAIAEKQGYIDTAFGLRIRTPIVGKSVLNTSKTPFQASAEARSVGNAISGQSYGLLTNRAMNAIMEKVWNSQYRTDILPIAMIHDAVYFIIRDDIRIIEWLNDNLIKEMQWQELPELQHPDVKLGAELDLFPSWDKPITLPNGVNQSEIRSIVKKAITKTK